jgi:hypothetical protein
MGIIIHLRERESHGEEEHGQVTPKEGKFKHFVAMLAHIST